MKMPKKSHQSETRNNSSTNAADSDDKKQLRFEFAEIAEMRDGSLQLFVNGRRSGHSIELNPESAELKLKVVIEGLKDLCNRDGINPVPEDKLKEVAKKAFANYVNGKNRNGRGNGRGKKGKQQEQKTTTTTPKDQEQQRVIPVSDALRAQHEEWYRVYGMISTMSTVYRMVTGQLFKCTNCGLEEHVIFEMALPQPPDLRTAGYSMKCSKCGGPRIPGSAVYVPAVTVELMDTDTFSEIERLTAIFFGDDTKDINVGERVSITGILHVVQNRRRGKLFTVLHTHSVEYESREKLELTSKDIGAIKRWVELVGGPEKAIEKLTTLFAPDVIGYDAVKEGLLMVAASSGPDIRSKTRKRIHAALVGPPGLAKTMLLRAAAAHVPGSRFETAQQASGKSLTAVVVREEEMYHLKLGPAALARQAVLAINEAGRMSEEDQSFLLDVLEEGEFTINKYGFNARIRADASVVISSNPRSTDWTATGGDDKIDLNEIPTLKELLDRIDLRFIFKAVRDEKTVREYANEKANIESRMPVNYNFIRKYIAYARGIEPRFSEGARSILNEAYVSLITSENNAFVTPRARDTLFRIAKTRARLKLKEIVGIDEAKEAVSFLNTVSQQFSNTVAVPEDPHVVAYALMAKTLQKSAFGISLSELANIASDQNPQVAAYLKGGRDIGSNWRLRRVYLSLLEHTNIKQTHDRPIALQWFEKGGLTGSNSNPSDVSDVSEGTGSSNDNVGDNSSSFVDQKNNENAEKAASDASDTSDRKQRQSGREAFQTWNESVRVFMRQPEFWKPEELEDYRKHPGPDIPKFEVPCPCEGCDFKGSSTIPDAAIFATAITHGFLEHHGIKIGAMLKEMGYVTPSSVNSDADGEKVGSERSDAKQRQEAKPPTYFACPLYPSCEEQLEEPLGLLDHVKQHCPKREADTRFLLQQRGLLPDDKEGGQSQP
jgi:DNA replicative helicase MCM subunit Mcm2 (Cdc46/Mcm family)